MGVNYNNWKNNMLLQCLLSFYSIINEWYSLTVEYHYNIDIVLTYMYLPTCTFNVFIVLFIPLTHKLLHCKHFCLFWTRTLWIFQTEDLETCHRPITSPWMHTSKLHNRGFFSWLFLRCFRFFSGKFLWYIIFILISWLT